MPRDLAATNQCTFHHKTWAQRPWKEITSGSSGSYQQQKPRKLELARYGLPPSLDLPNQLKGVIMVATSGLARSNFGGRNVLCWKVQRVSIQNMYIVANVCINHFYIGWGTFVPEIHQYYQYYFKLLTVTITIVQFWIYANLHLLYLHFFEEGQSESKKHLSEEHLKEVRGSLRNLS